MSAFNVGDIVRIDCEDDPHIHNLLVQITRTTLAPTYQDAVAVRTLDGRKLPGFEHFNNPYGTPCYAPILRLVSAALDKDVGQNAPAV